MVAPLTNTLMGSIPGASRASGRRSTTRSRASASRSSARSSSSRQRDVTTPPWGRSRRGWTRRRRGAGRVPAAQPAAGRRDRRDRSSAATAASMTRSTSRCARRGPARERGVISFGLRESARARLRDGREPATRVPPRRGPPPAEFAAATRCRTVRRRGRRPERAAVAGDDDVGRGAGPARGRPRWPPGRRRAGRSRASGRRATRGGSGRRSRRRP